MKHPIFSRLFIAFALSLLAACAQLSPSYEEPTVNVTRIQPLPGEGLEQRFLIGISVQNPNNSSLNISGMSYSLKLQDIKVASGVSAENLSIPPFSEANLELQGSTSLFGSMRAIGGLLQNPGSAVSYAFEIKLTTGFWPWPISVVEAGSIDLQ